MEASASVERKRRRSWRFEEKLRIVRQTLEPGASVASIALTNGVNANQVLGWKRKHERGELRPRGAGLEALVPVRIAEGQAGMQPTPVRRSVAWNAGSMTIEFPGRAVLRIEGAADPVAIRAVMESLSR